MALIVSACATTPKPETLETLLARPASGYPVKGWVEDYDVALRLAAKEFPVTVPCGDVVGFFKAVAVPESGHDRTLVYMEPAPLNMESLGLLQLSVSDERGYRCGITDRESLFHPIRNLYCGVKILHRLQTLRPKENVYQAGGRYWSTLRRAREWPKAKQSGYLKFKAALGKTCASEG